MTLPYTLSDIISKVRKITARPSTSQITDAEIAQYINTFYVFDMPEHLRMESLRFNYQFVTTANIPVYDFPRNLYLTEMPPVYIAGYQSYMTQSRENFFRTNPSLNYLQEDIATGDGGSAYTGTLTQTPIMPGFKPNPPGAYSDSTVSGNDIEAQYLNWNVLITAEGDADATSGIPVWYSLVDDGQGNLFAPTQTTTNPSSAAGSVNYITGAVSITSFLDSSNNPVTITSGNTINAQYVPYVASRPQSVVFFQDQMYFYPVPDQAYTVSFEAYRYPFAFSASDVSAPTTAEPQLS